MKRLHLNIDKTPTVNQLGDIAFTEFLYPPYSDEDRDQIIEKLLDHLGLSAVRTNATKHGDVQVRLEKNE